MKTTTMIYLILAMFWIAEINYNLQVPARSMFGLLIAALFILDTFRDFQIEELKMSYTEGLKSIKNINR